MQLCIRNIAEYFKKTGATHAACSVCLYFGVAASFFLAVLLGSPEMDSRFHQRALQGCGRGSSISHRRLPPDLNPNSAFC